MVRLVFIAVACSVTLLGLSAGCARETVAHRQHEREANRILVLLRGSGIEAQKAKDDVSRDLRFNVMVGARDASRALLLLEKYNLPEEPRAGTAESFGAGGMIPTAEQQRAKRIVGVEGDIVNSLRQIPRVVSAEAAVSIPESDPLRDDEDRPRPKASVILVYLHDGNGQPPVSEDAVQQHVQAKLPGVTSEEVNVLLLPSGAGRGASGVVGASKPHDIGGEPGCPSREQVLGIEVCEGEGTKVLGGVVAAMAVSSLMAALAVVAAIRALRYRRELARVASRLQPVQD